MTTSKDNSRLLTWLAAATVVTACLAPSARADGRNPGSALIFPVQRSGPDFFTIVSVSNTNIQPMTPSSLGGSTALHYEYANAFENQNSNDPMAPFRPLNCVVFDRIEFVTPADHLSVVTSCHNAVAIDGQEGYLVVSAQDPNQFDVPWSFNYLMGSELVMNTSGGMYSINAISFQSPKPTKRSTDADGDGRLDFNGREYEAAPDELIIDSFMAVAGSRLALLNLTGSARDVNTVHFTIWNDNEFAMSSTLAFNCWFDQPLSLVTPLFQHDFLANSTPHDPDELLINCGGMTQVETGWAKIDSIDVSTPAGLPVSGDGVILGAITAGPTTVVDGGRLLWETKPLQNNGELFTP